MRHPRPVWYNPQGQEVTNYIPSNRFRDVLVQLCAHSPEVVESDTIEVKGWCYDERDLADKLSDAAACLANARGGILLIGIQGEPYGPKHFSPCPYPNVNPAWLTARVHDLTVPPVEHTAHDLSDVAYELVEIKGVRVFALEIPRTKFVSGHMTVGGVSKIRVGKECRPYYTAEDDRTRVHVPGVSTEDLSLSSIRWAIRHHHRKFQTHEAEWIEPWDFLAEARLIDPYMVDGDVQPRYHVPLATLILFGKQGALSQNLGFFETILMAKNGEKRLRKNVVESVQELCGTDQASITALCPGVPKETIQELLVNAYVHRCYRTCGPIVITSSSSLLEISNPGELLGGLHVDNLIHCVPVYRNLSLADGARFIGLCDKIGRGIDLVYESVLSGGFDLPLFESSGNFFIARISLERGREFSEFIRRRSQSLSSLDEILALRVLWSRERATL